MHDKSPVLESQELRNLNSKERRDRIEDRKRQRKRKREREGYTEDSMVVSVYQFNRLFIAFFFSFHLGIQLIVEESSIFQLPLLLRGSYFASD